MRLLWRSDKNLGERITAILFIGVCWKEKELREFCQANDGYEFESNKEYQRARRLWLKFRLPWSSYLELFKKGRGVCWICGRVTDLLAVDHDHETGRTRGLLCVPCNVALGKFEQTEWREAALHYLETLSVACVTG